MKNVYAVKYINSIERTFRSLKKANEYVDKRNSTAIRRMDVQKSITEIVRDIPQPDKLYRVVIVDEYGKEYKPDIPNTIMATANKEESL